MSDQHDTAAAGGNPGRPAWQTWTERVEFLALVQHLGEGNEIQEAALGIAIEMETAIPAPWAHTDPLAAERYLAARGASPAKAAARAREFEVTMRALYALGTGRPAETFGDLITWIERVEADR